ncbi:MULTISPECIES: hypothetical protein [unclassified Cryobacterium]|uniref:hypothetical protein n=1 Tax=unclassified Cryobacterium TaxID=2649013 RepID=UPI002AB4612D|nr:MULTISPECIES: hypothetical protein [unclassified Cryobacterium]MDY7528704.1 hypothetical protein [Cryobacterium sp. 10C2]MDY7555555.1 hypothetical protein [Cryobacterium sp. 10C3]MEB0203714.1 hypothetical protein [Cryobacterium sp. 5I3]MEB0287119.1 hypothetical protein [Cryobacterium sp. 10S3]MEB0292249.1 hypothetical protein [Cryobacterium sp. 10C2]
MKEPSNARDNALAVSCQTAIDLSTAGKPPDDESLVTLLNNIASLSPEVGGLLQVKGLNEAAAEELAGKRNAVQFYVQLERFKDAVCVVE